MTGASRCLPHAYYLRRALANPSAIPQGCAHLELPTLIWCELRW